MSLFLKQSTPVTIKLGPFVDDTDGKTAETGLTLLQADVRLSKNGGDIAQKNEASASTHDELGYYDVALDDTDTGTLGRLLVAVSEGGALPVWAEFMVVPANVWDSLFGADRLQVDVEEIGNDVLTAAAIADDAIGDQPVASVTAAVTVATNNDKAGYSLASAPPTSAQIDAQLSATHGAGLWGGAGGTGSETVVIPTTTAAHVPIPGADVLVYSDLACTVLVASGVPDAFGNTTVYLDPGTYYIVRQLAGWNFDNPEERVVP